MITLAFDLQIPRDRFSEFELIIVPKGQRRLAGLDEKILALYARGSSTRDIQAQLEELYGIELSPTLISQVTDAITEEVRQWQTPLQWNYGVNSQSEVMQLPVSSFFVVYIRLNSRFVSSTGQKPEMS